MLEQQVQRQNFVFNVKIVIHSILSITILFSFNIYYILYKKDDFEGLT